MNGDNKTTGVFLSYSFCACQQLLRVFTPAEQPFGFLTICPPAASIRVTILWAVPHKDRALSLSFSVWAADG